MRLGAVREWRRTATARFFVGLRVRVRPGRELRRAGALRRPSHHPCALQLSLTLPFPLSLALSQSQQLQPSSRRSRPWGLVRGLGSTPLLRSHQSLAPLHAQQLRRLLLSRQSPSPPRLSSQSAGLSSDSAHLSSPPARLPAASAAIELRVGVPWPWESDVDGDVSATARGWILRHIVSVLPVDQDLLCGHLRDLSLHTSSLSQYCLLSIPEQRHLMSLIPLSFVGNPSCRSARPWLLTTGV